MRTSSQDKDLTLQWRTHSILVQKRRETLLVLTVVSPFSINNPLQLVNSNEVLSHLNRAYNILESIITRSLHCSLKVKIKPKTNSLASELTARTSISLAQTSTMLQLHFLLLACASLEAIFPMPCLVQADSTLL